MRRAHSPITSPGIATRTAGAKNMPPLESADRIKEACGQLLREAGVRDALPTPVEDIVAASELRIGSNDLFSEEMLERAPKDMADRMRALKGKVRAVLDRRERKVYVSPEVQLAARRRFLTLHEVGHDILPWQRDLYFPDDDYTLSWAAKKLQEREANCAGAEMLFQGDFFARTAAEFRVGMAEIADISGMFGASTQAGLRRFAEGHEGAVAGMVMQRSPATVTPLTFKRREAVSSALWSTRFPAVSGWPKVLDVERYPFLAEVGRLGIEPPPIAFTTQLLDLEGEMQEVHGQLVSNSYNVLVLLWVPAREWLKRRRAFAVTSA